MTYLTVQSSNSAFTHQQKSPQQAKIAMPIDRSFDSKEIKMHTDFDHSVNLIFAEEPSFILGYN